MAKRAWLVAALALVGICGLLASLTTVHRAIPSAAQQQQLPPQQQQPQQHPPPPPPPPPLQQQTSTALIRGSSSSLDSSIEQWPATSPPPPVKVASRPCATHPRINATSANYITLDVGEHGQIRLILRPEWSAPSTDFAQRVAAAGAATSQVYRLEPGFLIQGRLLSMGVPPNRDKTRAPKLMERGEVGWAGGSAGPDYFIYLGTGPATWLGNPHDGTIFADVADEASMAVANNVSLLPVPPTAPGQMHTLKSPVAVTPSLGHRGGATSVAGAPVANARDGALDGVPTLGVLKVAGAALDTAATDCGPACHALAHTELHGDVVKWGEKNLLDSAPACCASCQEHAAANPGRPCNVWVWCSNEQRCTKRHKQCWLKHAKALWANKELVVGTSEAWTAGTTEPAPADHPSGAGRVTPAAAAADLAIEIALSPAEASRVAGAGAGADAGAGAGAGDGAGSAGGSSGVVVVRVKLREAAPRSSARVRSHADVASAEAAGWAAAVAAAAEGSPACLAPASPLGLLTGGRPTPAHWGLPSSPDGFGAEDRWPRDAAVVRGVLGPAARWPAPSETVAVEAHPVPVLRGSVAWSTIGTDGPDFFIALADHPHFGIAHTVWAEVVREDLHLLDRLNAFGQLQATAAPLRVRKLT